MPKYKLNFSAVAELYIEADNEEKAREIGLNTEELDWESVELESIEEEEE